MQIPIFLFYFILKAFQDTPCMVWFKWRQRLSRWSSDHSWHAVVKGTWTTREWACAVKYAAQDHFSGVNTCYKVYKTLSLNFSHSFSLYLSCFLCLVHLIFSYSFTSFWYNHPSSERSLSAVIDTGHSVLEVPSLFPAVPEQFWNQNGSGDWRSALHWPVVEI